MCELDLCASSEQNNAAVERNTNCNTETGGDNSGGPMKKQPPNGLSPILTAEYQLFIFNFIYPLYT